MNVRLEKQMLQVWKMLFSPVTVGLSQWVYNGYCTDDSYEPGLDYITGYYQGNYHGR